MSISRESEDVETTAEDGSIPSIRHGSISSIRYGSIPSIRYGSISSIRSRAPSRDAVSPDRT
ncbi:hypothetical protein GCM10008992_27030 [Halorubrum aquaticum]